MSVATHEVLPINQGLRMLPAVRDTLISFGAASNHAAMTLSQALLTESVATITGDLTRARQRRDGPEANTADLIANSAVSFVEQLIVIYAITTARYAAYATATAAALAAGQEPLVATEQDLSLLPSQIIKGFDVHLPLVQFPEHTDRSYLEQENRRIREARERLTTVVGVRMDDDDPQRYDDPIAVAGAPLGSVELSQEFPTALHNYAATLTWAIGIAAGAALPGD